MGISEILNTFKNPKIKTMKNYFNSLSFREKLMQLGRCRFMDSSEEFSKWSRSF